MRELSPRPSKLKDVEIVAAWLVLPNDAVQLQRRPTNAKHDADKLALFGGKVEPGETHLQALFRELDEELWVPRLELGNMACRDIFQTSFSPEQTMRSKMLLHVYEVPIDQRIEAIDGRAEVFSPEQLARIKSGDMTLGARAAIDYIGQKAVDGRSLIAGRQ